MLSYANFSSALVALPSKKAATADARFKLVPQVLDHSKEALSTSEEARNKVQNSYLNLSAGSVERSVPRVLDRSKEALSTSQEPRSKVGTAQYTLRRGTN